MLSIYTCFCRFKPSLVVNSHLGKPKIMALPNIWTSTFGLSKGAYMTKTSGQSAWGIWIFQFSSKLPRSLQSTFSLILRFLKRRFWVTWLKCLVIQSNRNLFTLLDPMGKNRFRKFRLSKFYYHLRDCCFL